MSEYQHDIQAIATLKQRYGSGWEWMAKRHLHTILRADEPHRETPQEGDVRCRRWPSMDWAASAAGAP